MRSTTLVIALLAITTSISAQRPEKPPINAYYKGKVNPFREVLGLSIYTTSLSRDSARIPVAGGGSIDLILDQRRLWRFRQYDREGKPMDAGDLQNGTGHVHFVNNTKMLDLDMRDGILNGPVVESRRINGKWLPMHRFAFEDGLLQGEARWQSMWNSQYTATIQQFDKGVIQKSETYGRRYWLWGWLRFLPKYIDKDKVCCRTVYVDGIPQPTECILSRKCRTCGMP